MLDVFKEALPIIEQLQDNGYQAYFVGGAVRDLHLNREIGDIDIATSAPPEVVQSLFDKVLPIGLEHGTVVVLYQNNQYEVTTFRTDGEYQDFRHPESVQYVQTVEEDLSRRDFTINAMAMNKDGEVIDPFQGKEDLNKKVLRTVGEATDRFQEDPLRMMRAFRFVSQLDFELEEKTELAILKHAHLLEKIAIERISVEFEKLLSGIGSQKALQLMQKNTIDKHIPVFKRNVDLFSRIVNSSSNEGVKSFEELITYLANVEPRTSIQNWTKEWKLSNHVKKNSFQLQTALQCYLEMSLSNLCLYELNETLLPSFYRLIHLFREEHLSFQELTEKYNQLPIKNTKQLAIDGNEIKQVIDKKAGPWMKALIQELEKAVLLGQVTNQKEHLKDWLLLWNQRAEK